MLKQFDKEGEQKMYNKHYEMLAERFCKTIKTINEKPENLHNMESYLAYNLPEWIKKEGMEYKEDNKYRL